MERTGSCKANEFSSAYLSGLIHTKPTGAWDREKQEEGASVQQGSKDISRGTENQECLDWIAEETDGVTLSKLFGYKRGAFWPVPVEVKV